MANDYDDYDVVINLILESESAKAAADNASESFLKLSKSVDEASDYLQSQKQILSELQDEYKKLEDKQRGLTKRSEEYLKLERDKAALKPRINEQIQNVRRETQEYQNLNKQLQNSVDIQDKEISALRKTASLRAKEIQDLRERAQWIERGSKVMMGVGLAAVTAIAASAKNYVDNAGESNEITERWATASEKVKDAQLRIGKVAAETILPMFEKIADVAQAISEFAEKNPEVVDIGLKAALGLTAVGGLGVLISKGISLYADVSMIAVGDTQLLAAKMMASAAKDQLLAAGVGTKGGAVGKVIGGGAAAAGGEALAGGGAAAAGTAAGASVLLVGAVTALALAIGTYIGSQWGNLLGKVFYGSDFEADLGNVIQSIYRLFSLPALMLVQKLHDIGLVSDETARKMAEFTTGASNWIGTVTGAIGAQNASTAATAAGTKANEESAKAAVNNAQAVNRNAQESYRSGVILSGVTSAARLANQALSQAPSVLANAAKSVLDFLGSIFSGSHGSGVPVHDYTGYAYSRIYAMAQDGKPQFVMSGDMTRFSEQLLGGKLNQQSMLNTLIAGANANRTAVTWNDRRSFSGEYTQSMRNANRRDTLNILAEVFS